MDSADIKHFHHYRNFSWTVQVYQARGRIAKLEGIPHVAAAGFNILSVATRCPKSKRDLIALANIH